MIRFTIHGNPRTKKNSQVVVNHIPLPSKSYREYEKETADLWKYEAAVLRKPVNYPVNVKCVYYMETRRKVDLTNLLECSDDLMVKYGILADDNSSIVVGHDGSRVQYDKASPRVEITITRIEGWVIE